MKIKLYDEEKRIIPEVNKNFFDEEWLNSVKTNIEQYKVVNLLFHDLNTNKQFQLIVDLNKFNDIKKQLKDKKSEIKL